jgi:nucleoside phosphorylase
MAEQKDKLEQEKRKSAILNITKAVMQVSLVTLAAIGSASGNIWIAGLTALPAASLSASETIGSEFRKLKAAPKEEQIVLPVPGWWPRDSRTWQNLCDEISSHLPHILQSLAERLQQEQRVMTQQVIYQAFVEAIVDENLTWAFDPVIRRRAAEAIAPQLLRAIATALAPLIEQKQRDTYLLDTRQIEENTRRTAELLEKISAQGRNISTPSPLPQSAPEAPEKPHQMPTEQITISAEGSGPAQQEQGQVLHKAFILTAISLEYQAVMAHLTNVEELSTERGAIYEQGGFVAGKHRWQVVVHEAGAGNVQAAGAAERAIGYLQPDVVLFVGIAGGVKDVKIGDVVASTKVYNYDTGKEGKTTKMRPELFRATYAMEQRAKAVARQGQWRQRLLKSILPEPQAFVGPIASGERVIASTHSRTYALLRKSFNDALAVEMEGYGFLYSAFTNRQVEALVVRGISDLLDQKSEDALGRKIEDEEEHQQRAAECASAFAFEVLSTFFA